MKTKHLIKSGLLPCVMAAALVLSGGCTEQEDPVENTGKYIVINYTDTVIEVQPTPAATRGTKVTTGGISSLGVSASVYPAGNSYTSAGCGSYFFKEEVASGTPTHYYWPTSAYKLAFFAYYPYNNAAFTVQSTASATGAPTYAYTVPSSIASQLDVMTGQNVNITGGGTAAVNLTMKHRCASICFSVTNSRSSAITLSSVSIEGVKYSGTLNEETWTLASAVNSSVSNPFTLSYGSSIAAGATVNVTGTTNIFMMLPQTLPATAKVKVVVAGEDPLYADITGSWVAGTQYNYSLNVKNNTLVVVDEETEIEDWKTRIDLSMVDNAGNARATMTTANCYLIHEAGIYKLPLVYGNAIKNDKVNTEAFNPTGTSSSTFLKPFLNHNGDGITGPWITKSGSGINAGMGLTVASAELLWQDASGLISAVGIDGNYLTFNVETFTPGNALIAIKNDDGEILWTWHIWATLETYSSTTTVSGYEAAPVNLGWVPEEGTDNKRGYCPYYQWGRMTPFPPSTGAGNANHSLEGTQTNIMATVYTSEGTGEGYGTIANGIKYPLRFYYNNISGNDGRYGLYQSWEYNLWDAINTQTTYNRTVKTTKTIYDPCPPGFCVPTSGFFTYMDNNSSSLVQDKTTYYGYEWGGELWFYAGGTRARNNPATPGSVRQWGYYWSATPYSKEYANHLRFHFLSKYFKGSYPNSYRCEGFLVRPVAED